MSTGLWLNIAIIALLGLYAIWEEFKEKLIPLGLFVLVLVVGGIGLYALVAVLHWLWRIT